MINQFKYEYSFLSNFFPCIILQDGYEYSSVEHAFQATKACSLLDRELIRNAKTPKESKYLGHKIQIRRDWDKIKNNIMIELVRKKFMYQPLKSKLINTNDEFIEEGNYWHDNHFGNCKCPKCALIVGENVLGNILMQVRLELRNN